MALLWTGWSCAGILLSFDDLRSNIWDRHANGVIYATFSGILPFKCAINQPSHWRDALACEFNLLLILRQSPLDVCMWERGQFQGAASAHKLLSPQEKGAGGISPLVCVCLRLSWAKNSSGSRGNWYSWKSHFPSSGTSHHASKIANVS